MQQNSIFIFHQRLLNYKFSENHPFNPKRLELTYDLINEFQLLAKEQIISPRYATDEELNLIHDMDYIKTIKLLSMSGQCDKNCTKYGIGTEDNPIFKNMHEITSLIVGGAIEAVERIMNGQVYHALHLAGGLHHALQGQASGFCIYNDASVAIAYLRKNYNLRVLYLDTDAHHGDGVQWAFYEDPNVLTISIHETGRYLFPGTGHISERGNGKGYGYSVNVPLDAFTEDDSFLEALYQVVPIMVEKFKPDIIVSQNGCDSHLYDPLTHLNASMRIYKEIPKLVHQLAHSYSGGKWLALGGGGYDIWRVVPRAWTLLWAEMNDKPLDQQALPTKWLEKWQKESPVMLPANILDNVSQFPSIPRKEEITEKNRFTIRKVLEVLPESI